MPVGKPRDARASRSAPSRGPIQRRPPRGADGLLAIALRRSTIDTLGSGVPLVGSPRTMRKPHRPARCVHEEKLDGRPPRRPRSSIRGHRRRGDEVSQIAERRGEASPAVSPCRRIVNFILSFDPPPCPLLVPAGRSRFFRTSDSYFGFLDFAFYLHCPDYPVSFYRLPSQDPTEHDDRRTISRGLGERDLRPLGLLRGLRTASFDRFRGPSHAGGVAELALIGTRGELAPAIIPGRRLLGLEGVGAGEAPRSGRRINESGLQQTRIIHDDDSTVLAQGCHSGCADVFARGRPGVRGARVERRVERRRPQPQEPRLEWWLERRWL